MSDGAHDNFLDRKEKPPHPVEWRGYYIDQKHYDDLVAELARLRELLTNAYTVKPLAWFELRPGIWNASGYIVRESAVEEGRWVALEGSHDRFGERFDSVEEAKAAAESWHIARVTAQLTKVEPPTTTRNQQ